MAMSCTTQSPRTSTTCLTILPVTRKLKWRETWLKSTSSFYPHLDVRVIHFPSAIVYSVLIIYSFPASGRHQNVDSKRLQSIISLVEDTQLSIGCLLDCVGKRLAEIL